MDKHFFYGKRETDKGVALVPLHPSDSELDSSDDDTRDETVHADTSEARPSQDYSVTSSPDRSATTSLERGRLSLSASRSCPPSRKAKGRNRVLVPVSDDEDDSDKAIADVMPLKRFQALRRYVHFANNLDNGTNSDRFWKVRPLFENLREQFLKIPAERKQSIDEVMVAYKGTRAGNLRQYVSNKPDKWGFKIFCRSSSTGIIHDMLLYQGSSTFFNVSLSSEEQGLLLGAKVVLALSRTIDEPQHSVLFFDNFSTNYNLIEFMKAELNISLRRHSSC
ncbi:hypothetical protein HPB50_013050 [Hyalomma asiaticum]|uniref:Uncharacterized protein n=1 Tax=Hyalomma asiaticum TaxID=266040 RepID=A0ACB7RW42_HYAAI|nr:hypothetical protein HPB50_013050 [Hyalomma asiaticum]